MNIFNNYTNFAKSLNPEKAKYRSCVGLDKSISSAIIVLAARERVADWSPSFAEGRANPHTGVCYFKGVFTEYKTGSGF